MSSVVQLERPADITSRVRLAALPDSNTLPLKDLALCTVSGWGVTWLPSYTLSPELRSVDVNIFHNCWYYYYFRITENMICAGSLLGGKDACQVHTPFKIGKILNKHPMINGFLPTWKI